MPRKRSSSRAWLREHHDDDFVKQARRDGYRSRACYKLLEVQGRDRLLRRGQTVVDLGAAPGGWCQVAVQEVMPGGRVIASDILPMEPLPGVTFIQGDFSEQGAYDSIISEVGGNGVDVVLSDMAPNMSGMVAVDQPRALHLVELALDFACSSLRPGGAFLTKVFQGEGFDPLLAAARGHFDRVVVRKPRASRPRSREVYLLASGRRG